MTEPNQQENPHYQKGHVPEPDRDKPEQPGGYDKPEQPPGYGKPKEPPRYDKPEQPPGYDKPKEPGGYEEPEKPPYKPKEEGGNGKGVCHCPPWPTDELPQDGSIRRLLQALETKLQDPKFELPPTQAVTDFKTALEECDKEYQAISEIVKKYREYHCKLDCELDKAESWCEDIKAWCESLDEPTRDKIRQVWKDCYEAEGHRRECQWIGAGDCVSSLEDCLKQAEKTQTEAQQDFNAAKEFEKTLKDRFAALKTLYDRAKSHQDAKEIGAVCAVGYEFRKIYHQLDELLRWKDRRDRCNGEVSLCRDDCQRPDLKAIGSEWLRNTLVETLRELILAKFQYFCWRDHKLRKVKDRDDKKQYWEDFRDTRRDKFIQEAQECAEETQSNRAAA